MKRLVPVIAAAHLAACAGASHGPAALTPLTSVDTAYYEVPGITRPEWARNLPRAAETAGLRSGAVSFTVGRVAWVYAGTHIASNGCQLDGMVVRLRLGHVMPRLTAGATASASERAPWEAFVGTLWEGAHAREVVGARMADSLRAELKRSPTFNCAELIAVDREKVARFPARYMAAVQADERARGSGGEPDMP